MPKLPQPNSQTTAILKALISTKGISERDTNYNGFRARISELRLDYSLPIKKKMIDFKNAFGRNSKYSFHFIEKENKKQLIDLYLKMIKDDKKM
ncbi:MAG: hypothetical protein ACOVMM_04650 [Chitinophagaceae bacterium]